MSAIAGIMLTRGREAGASRIGDMLAAMGPRVRDGREVAAMGPVALGAGLLATRGSMRGKTLIHAEGPATIVADARLDNSDELAARLNTGPGLSDAALILKAYLKWGEECPRHLLGDFAFAIHDSRLQAIFAARDHAGVRSFHYHDSGGVFCFATDV